MEAITNLATTVPRGAVIWEVRGLNGHVTHLLGADQMYIGKLKEVFRAHGDVQFRKASAEDRQPAAIARSLKITHPQLSLNTNIAEVVVRAGLAAMVTDRSGKEVVLQVVLGRAYAPAPTSANLDDPTASWLEVLTGSVSKATAESRKSVREKAEQHGFQAAVRIGVSDEKSVSQLRSLISAFRVLESAGVRIYDEAESVKWLNTAHVPWTFSLRLSAKELSKNLYSQPPNAVWADLLPPCRVKKS